MEKEKTIEQFMKIIFTSIMTIVISACFALIIYLHTDIESIVPTKIEQVCSIKKINIQNRNVYFISPKEYENPRIKILYLHGGAYFGDITKEHWEFFKTVVKDTGAMIIVPDYPLAPKNEYKEAFAFVEHIYKLIIEKEHDNLILMGDSAGGGLALALVEKMGEAGITIPKKTILISPWLDCTLSNQKIDEVQKVDPDLDKEALKIAGKIYAGKDGMETYIVNPINGPLDKLKNVTIYTGTHDILNPDVHLLIQKAKEQGSIINLEETEGAIHIWILKRHNEKVLHTEEAYQKLIEDIKGGEQESGKEEDFMEKT